jgi:hypothetical protein
VWLPPELAAAMAAAQGVGPAIVGSASREARDADRGTCGLASKLSGGTTSLRPRIPWMYTATDAEMLGGHKVVKAVRPLGSR